MNLFGKRDRSEEKKRVMNTYWMRQMEPLCKLERAGYFRIELEEHRIFMDDRLARLFIANKEDWENFLYRLSVYAGFREALNGVKPNGTYWNFHYYILSTGRIVSAFGLYEQGKSTLSASV